MVKNLPEKQEPQVTETQSLGQEDPVEEEMAAYFSILAGIIHAQRSLLGCYLWDLKESDRAKSYSAQMFYLAL